MKNLILFGLLFLSFQAFSQKKMQIEEQALAIDSLVLQNSGLMAQVDSLKSINASLASALDSTSKGLDLYYSTLKDKVLIEDFDPSALPEIIDSLKNARAEKLIGLTTTSASLSDSITVLTTEIDSLKETLTSIKNADDDKDKLVAELKQLKELLDSGIITQEEYDAKKEDIMKKW